VTTLNTPGGKPTSAADQRRIGRRLQDHGATGQKCRQDLADRDVERNIPGNDRTNHARRFFDHNAAVTRAPADALTQILFPLDLVEQLE
jgi:hypothetical protein